MNILIKPASGACNMRCSYCFYADEMAHRERGIVGMMSIGTLAVIVRKTLDRAPGIVPLCFRAASRRWPGLISTGT